MYNLTLNHNIEINNCFHVAVKYYDHYFVVAVNEDLDLLGFTTELDYDNLILESVKPNEFLKLEANTGCIHAIKPGTENEFLSDYYDQFDAYNEWWETIDHKEFTKKLVDIIL